MRAAYTATGQANPARAALQTAVTYFLMRAISTLATPLPKKLFKPSSVEERFKFPTNTFNGSTSELETDRKRTKILTFSASAGQAHADTTPSFHTEPKRVGLFVGQNHKDATVNNGKQRYLAMMIGVLRSKVAEIGAWAGWLWYEPWNCVKNRRYSLWWTSFPRNLRRAKPFPKGFSAVSC